LNDILEKFDTYFDAEKAKEDKIFKELFLPLLKPENKKLTWN